MPLPSESQAESDRRNPPTLSGRRRETRAMASRRRDSRMCRSAPYCWSVSRGPWKKLPGRRTLAQLRDERSSAPPASWPTPRQVCRKRPKACMPRETARRPSRRCAASEHGSPHVRGANAPELPRAGGGAGLLGALFPGGSRVRGRLLLHRVRGMGGNPLRESRHVSEEGLGYESRFDQGDGPPGRLASEPGKTARRGRGARAAPGGPRVARRTRCWGTPICNCGNSTRPRPVSRPSWRPIRTSRTHTMPWPPCWRHGTGREGPRAPRDFSQVERAVQSAG